MIIKRFTLDCMDIRDFADKHNLVMEVHERTIRTNTTDRYYAYFTHSEILANGVLGSAFGNGATENLAINNYAKEISLKTLVIDAYTPRRREIEIPILIYGVGD